MASLEIKTYSDKHHPDLMRFRETMYREDFGVDARYLYEPFSREAMIQALPAEIAEDAYKFSFQKWNNVSFDLIYAAIVDDKVAGISGLKRYGKYLRVSMHLYLLKKFRGSLINLKYRSGGYFEQQLAYAKETGAEAVFFSIFAHNQKTRTLLTNHTRRTISTLPAEQLHHRAQIQSLKELIVFNGVPQNIFYLPLKENLVFNPEELNQ